MTPEKKFETDVKGYLKDSGCWLLKTWSNGVQRKGVPDLLVSCNGYFLGVELKADNGNPTDLQRWNISHIRKSGGIALILYPVQFKAFKKLVEQLKAGRYEAAKISQYVFDIGIKGGDK